MAHRKQEIETPASAAIRPELESGATWPTLPEEQRRRLHEAVQAHGTAKVARWIGCNSETLARVIAGLRVHNATLLLIGRATFEREPRSVPEAV